MKARKAQLAIFVIIAIFIVCAVAFVAMTQREIIKAQFEKLKITPEVKPIDVYVEDCFEKTGKEAVLYTSTQAGYYTLLEPFLIYKYTEFIPYLYEGGKLKLLELEEVEKEISNYIKDEIEPCLDFENLKKQGFEISKGKPNVVTRIGDRRIVLRLNLPITIKKGTSTVLIDKFSISINSNLRKILDAANYIIIDYSKKPGFICLTCLDGFRDPHISVRAVPATSPTVTKDRYIIFLIKDEQYKINDENLIFRFVVEA